MGWVLYMSMNLDQAMLVAKLSEYFELEDAIAELQKRQDAIKSELRESLIQEGKTKSEEGIYKMQLIPYQRTSFDTKGFAASHPRLAKKFTRETSYTQFRITRKASKK